jgi:hypothetical protein
MVFCVLCFVTQRLDLSRKASEQKGDVKLNIEDRSDLACGEPPDRERVGAELVGMTMCSVARRWMRPPPEK